MVAAATVAMATVCDNGNEGNEATGVEGTGGREQWFAAAMPVAMASAANNDSGNGGGRQRWLKRRQHEGRQQSIKKWQQRWLKNYFKCNILNITQLRRKEQGAAVCGCDASGNGVRSQQWQWWGQATVP
jgi:hypothetical protein